MDSGGFQFENEVYCLKCNSFNTAVAAADRIPASGSFIDMLGIGHGVFLIAAGTLDTAANWQVYQDTSAIETGSIKVITGAVAAELDTDDNKWFTVEFDAEDLDRANSFRYVTIVPSGGAGSNDYACVFFLGFKNKKTPVTQPANYAYHVSV
jgi:hypothetical protein